MDIPGMPGKGMYLLQAYHQLHCLVRHTPFFQYFYFDLYNFLTITM
jgi:hypothetical protein